MQRRQWHWKLRPADRLPRASRRHPKAGVALGDALPDGGGVRQHSAAGIQRFLFPCRQRGVLDLLNLIAQQVNAALFFRFIGDDGIQFLFDLDEFPVDRIIFLKFCAVLGIGVQNALVAGRVQ